MKKINPLPEIVAVAAGIAVWYYLHSRPPGYHESMQALMIASLLAALLSAIFYCLAKRPKMWSYMPAQLVSYVLFDRLTYTPPSPDRPPNDLGPFLYLISLFLICICLLPALPVCAIYKSIFAERFGDKSSKQGSENP